MTKKAIIQIIILMSAALMGIVGMQIYFINNTLKLSYEVFDNNVHAALDHVVSRLEQLELQHTATRYNLPRPTLTAGGSEIAIAPSVVAIDEISSYLQPDSLNASRTDTLAQEHYPQLEEKFRAQETRKTWKKGSNEAFRIHFERFFVHHSIIQHIPVDKRTSLLHIENVLREELGKAGIATDYVFGVFSLSRDSFLFRRSFCPELDLSDHTRPHNFSYWIQLFPSSEQAEAVLHIEFPHRKQFVWRGIVFHLIGTLLLAAIIIFCFYYTIRIIYNQKKVSEMKTDFLNNMTHEFKTPIATISLASDAIRSLLGGQKYDKIDRFVRIIKEENARMLTQVEQVLQIARIEKRDLRLKLQEVDLRVLAEKAISSISLQIEKREGTIKTDFRSQRTLLQADETHLTNAILNLLDNANKYSPTSPRISISIQDAPNNSGLLLSVSDEGLGISKEAAKSVFEAFYRVSTGNLHDVKGFGLGLSYVKSIASAHGGEVSLQSELGKGSTFTLFLPFRNPQAEQSE